jgi:exodeoxyribonuclease VII large subunit
LVTSPTGAAIRDVLHVVERRFAGLEFVLVPVRVQGDGAAEMIADAVRSLNDWARETPGGLDAILVTRGGGSLEDLWAFNEEVVARALAASEVPVLSAVGHEIDFTIADFVADLRAATPSAAAEVLTAGYVAAGGRVTELSRRLPAVFGRSLNGLHERLDRCWAALTRLHPRRQLEARAQRVDELTLSLTRVGRRRWRESVQAASGAAHRLALRRPSAVLALRRREWEELNRRLMAAVRTQHGRWRDRTDRARRSLELLSPQSVLDRGYSLTFDAMSGQLLRAAAEVEPGRRLRTRLASGELESVVEPRRTGASGS